MVLSGATSPEQRVAIALTKLGHQFLFQYQLAGGRDVRGGLVIDFLVLTTVPLSTPVEVYGDYWHSGQMGADDEERLARIEEEMLGKANPVVIFWEHEVSDQDKANQIVRERIGPR